MSQAKEFSGNTHRGLIELDAWTKQHHEDALEPQLPIIDTHHHLFDDGRGRYLADEFLKDIDSGHNVIATVFVEIGAMYRANGPFAEKTIGEVEFANGVAAVSGSGRYGPCRLCSAIVGNANLLLGDDVRPVLEGLVAAGNGRTRGIRQSLIWDEGNAAKFARRLPARHEALNPIFRQGFRHLQPLGLSFEAWLFYPQLPDLIDLLTAFPETTVILNHVGGLLGVPPHDGRRDEIFQIWRGYIRQLAQFPNLSVKLGGLGMPYAGWDFHFRDMPPASEELAGAWRPYIETCIEAFGVNRCMMESNFPVDKQSCGYGVLWNAMKRITRDCSTAEKSALYWETAARVYRL